MIQLVNIKKIDGRIECDYLYPEDPEKILGHIIYDVAKHDYISPSKSEHVHYGFSHIKNAMENMIKYNKYPKTYDIYWY